MPPLTHDITQIVTTSDTWRQTTCLAQERNFFIHTTWLTLLCRAGHPVQLLQNLLQKLQLTDQRGVQQQD